MNSIGSSDSPAIIEQTSTTNNIVIGDDEAAKLALMKERRDKHQQAFEDGFLLALNTKKCFYIINLAKAQKITNYLKGNYGEKPDANFKHYIKEKKYRLIIDGDEEVLYREEKTKGGELKTLPVAIKENFFDILYTIHSIQRGHCGVNKIEKQLKLRYHGIPRSIVSIFCATCSICNLKTVQHSQARLKPIRSDGFLNRLQIDLVDMRHNEVEVDGVKYKWICHVEDHFSKFHVIWPQKDKSAKEVVAGLEERVFAYFGLPDILQSDNGLEFKNSLMVSLLTSWDGSCRFVHGRPRHPQSNGLVEQANGTMERMIASMCEQFQNKNWVSFLPKIMFNLNTQHSSGN
jgi:transposase InsO family protein